MAPIALKMTAGAQPSRSNRVGPKLDQSPTHSWSRSTQINPYLVFNGQCEAAFKFYEKCLVGKIEAMIPHTGTPAEQFVPPDWRDKIMHARLVVGDEVLMGSDARPDHFEKP